MASENGFVIQDGVLEKYEGAESRVEIPEGVTVLKYFVFEADFTLEEVTVPGSVREIGAHAFRNCGHLKKVYITDGTEKIGSWAFSE